MKVTYQQYDEIAAKRQIETLNDGKDLLKWSAIWWMICLLLTFALITVSILLVRIGNMLCEISVNIRTTIRQNDDLRLLMTPSDSDAV
jgi:hypothetical protein